MSVPDGTPDPAPDRAPGRRRATPEKPNRRRSTSAAPTHARPAARPASRAPAGGAPALPPSDRPAARPARVSRAEDLRPYLPPIQDGQTEALALHPVTPVEGRVEPRPPVPERLTRPVAAPVLGPALDPRAVVSPPASAPVAAATLTPVETPAEFPADGPARPGAESRAATARPLARSRTAGPALARAPLADGEGWVAILLLGAFGIVLVRVAPDLPELMRQVCAIVVSGALAWGLAVRTGGRPGWAAGLSSVLAITAVATDWQPLIAGAAVGTGVLGATLAVMATIPAATFLLAIREVLVATAISAIGAIGVVGYGVDGDPDIDSNRLEYAVLVLSLVGAFALVYRLGAGLHGLGRRGYVVAAGAVLMLVFALAYSEAIAHWGSRDLVGTADDLRDWTRSTFGAVPHPIVALLGYPALVWGVFMRARRRQGWWVCAFGVAATGPVATRLVATDLSARSIVLGGVYSFVIGIALGYLAIRVEQSLTGSHGRRARRDEEAEAHRPEPRRTGALH